MVGKSCAVTSRMARVLPLKTNLYYVVAKMVEVTLKKGSGALAPPSRSRLKSDAQWCPDGLSRSTRATTVVGHLVRRHRTSHPLNRSNDVVAYLSGTGGAKWIWSWRSFITPNVWLGLARACLPS